MARNKYRVDVSCFISVEVEGDDEESARAEANRFVEACNPTAEFIGGWNHAQRAVGGPVIGSETNGFDIDGTSEVERLCGCGEETHHTSDALCWRCLEEVQVPDDTPSLDTSFHDHEMDV